MAPLAELRRACRIDIDVTGNGWAAVTVTHLPTGRQVGALDADRELAVTDALTRLGELLVREAYRPAAAPDVRWDGRRLYVRWPEFGGAWLWIDYNDIGGWPVVGAPPDECVEYQPTQRPGT